MDASLKLSHTALFLATALSLAAMASAQTLTVSPGISAVGSGTAGSPFVIPPGRYVNVSLTNPSSSAPVSYQIDLGAALASTYAYQQSTNTSCPAAGSTYCVVAPGANENLLITVAATTGTGQVVLDLSGGSPITIYFSIGAGSTTGTTGTLLPSVSPIQLAYPGTYTTQFMTVSVTANSANAEAFSAVAATSTGGQWLQSNCLNNSVCTGLTAPTASAGVSTPQLYISVNTAVAQNLATGVYNGSITLTNLSSGGGSDITTIPVTLSVNGASTGTGITMVAPTSLSFNCQSGSTYQYGTLLVNGSGTVSVTTTKTSTWPSGSGISASAGFQTAPTQVYVSTPCTMAAGTYTAQVSVSASGSYLNATIPVTVTVSSAAALVASPASLTWPSSPYTTQGVQLTSSDATNGGGTTMGLGVTSSASWLSVTGCGTTTPTACSVSINSSGLSSGLNSASIIVTSTNNSVNSTLSIPVAVLSNSGATGSLTFNPNSLTFTGSTLQPQTLYVIGSGSFSAAVTAGSDWLSISPSSYTAVSSPGTPVTVSVNGSSLTAGTLYTGTISFTPSGSTTPENVSVSFTPGSTSGTVTLYPATLSGFTAQASGQASAPQTVQVTSAGGSAAVAFDYSTSQPWIQMSVYQVNVGCGQGATSGQASTSINLCIWVDPSKLGVGNYSGTVTIGGQTLNVGATISAASTVSASPTSLSFAYTAGATSATPASGSITVSGTAAAQFTATASSTGNWLAISAASGTLPNSGSTTLTATLQNLTNLSVSSTPYTGTITVAGSGSSVGSTTINVSLTVSAPLPTIITVKNGASFNTGQLAAGEAISIFGTELGPSTPVPLTSDLITNGVVPKTLGGVSVTVGGYAAPMLYASATQVNALVPYEINRPGIYVQNLPVIVKYFGQSSNGYAETQAAAAPGIFSADSSGSGPAVVIDPALSNPYVSAANPANKGDIVALFITGEGQTQPSGQTGLVIGANPPYPQSIYAPNVTINGQPAQVVFYGEAPYSAGVLQINVVIPSTAVSGVNPVVVSFGGAYSQMTSGGIGAVTVAVK